MRRERRRVACVSSPAPVVDSVASAHTVISFQGYHRMSLGDISFILAFVAFPLLIVILSIWGLRTLNRRERQPLARFSSNNPAESTRSCRSPNSNRNETGPRSSNRCAGRRQTSQSRGRPSNRTRSPCRRIAGAQAVSSGALTAIRADANHAPPSMTPALAPRISARLDPLPTSWTAGNRHSGERRASLTALGLRPEFPTLFPEIERLVERGYRALEIVHRNDTGNIEFR